MPQLSLHTPLGPLTLSAEDDRLVALDTGWGRDQDATALLCEARAQLHAYFDGELRQFDLPLAPHGSVYRQRVWTALGATPYGSTLSYTALAALAGGSARSVGQALGQNPLPILIPCHRVLAMRGLGGFTMGGDLEAKRFLLRREGVAV